VKRNKIFIICVTFTFLFLLIGVSISLLAAELTDEEQQSYRILKETNQFCDTAVGYAGITPDEVKAFRTILNGHNADSLFKRLLEEAKMPAKLYALCGLYYTDEERFRKEVEKFKNSKEEVETFRGCIISTETVGSIVESKKDNVVRLESKDQTIKEWVTKYKDKFDKGVVYDIVGGGWPNLFKEDGGYR
jgi:hypothetical protein